MWIKSDDGESIVNTDNLSMISLERKGNKFYIIAYDTGSTSAIQLGEFDKRREALNAITNILNAIIDLDGKTQFLMGDK